MADTHDCPGGCGAQVPQHQMACKPCWFRLPVDLRNAVNGTFRARQRTTGRRPDVHSAAVAAHRKALVAAFQWYREHPRPSGTGEVTTNG